MAKPIIGVDIGSDNLKLALVRGGVVKKTISLSMPKNLLREGRVTSADSMSNLIKTAIKTAGMRASRGAVVLPNEIVYVKSVVMPQMTAEQLEYNLPFEFHDYITEELHDYVFDYAMLGDPNTPAGEKDAEGEGRAEDGTPGMELLAVGMPRENIEEMAGILHKAGLRMVMAAPALCAYIALIRRKLAEGTLESEEICVVDLGYRTIRMYMFRGDRHMATRSLEVGLSRMDEVLAEIYNVDIHLAHTYLTTNYEGCQGRQECLNAYDSIAVELMRAVNFYHFSNPGTRLEDMWLCGGGAALTPLCQAIADSLDMRLHTADDLVPGGESIEDCNSFAQAVGIAISEA